MVLGLGLAELMAFGCACAVPAVLLAVSPTGAQRPGGWTTNESLMTSLEPVVILMKLRGLVDVQLVMVR